MQPTITRFCLNPRTLFWIAALLFILLLWTSHPAIASETSGENLPYEGWLKKIQKSMTGPVAFSLSMIGIVVAGGVLIFGGELNGFVRTLVFIVLVVSLLMGAQKIMQNLFGQGAEITAGRSGAYEANITMPLNPVSGKTFFYQAGRGNIAG
jgi:type IV secretory pathway VirB2 component (pilin)